MWGRRGFLLMINACSLSPSPRCSWSPSLLWWGEHGPASSRGSALDLSNWVRQRGQRLRRGSQAVETRSSRTELDLLGEADLAPVREEKTRPAFREGVMLRMPSTMWGRRQSGWHKSGGTRGRGPLAQFRQRQGGGPAAGEKPLGRRSTRGHNAPQESGVSLASGSQGSE